MNNWKHYIENKFSKQDFSISIDETSKTLTIIHCLSETTFIFLGISDDWSIISDIQFHNKRTEGWSGEFNKVLKYNKNTELQVDSFLRPVFETGWTSKDIFLFGKHFKSIVWWNLEQTGLKFKYYSSEQGCVSVIFLPIFEILSLFIGQIKIIKIAPIHSSNLLNK